MEAPGSKWWHVADKEVADFVTKLGGEDPFRATVVTAAARPPRPNVVNSPRPPVSASPTPRVASSSPTPRLAHDRPHIAPGTPLMTYRSNTPRSARGAPLSARRKSSPAPQKSDGKITVYAYNIHSSDQLVLRVLPDLKIGTSSPSRAKHDFTSLCQGDENDDPCGTSLKAAISHALGVDFKEIRLTFRGTPLGDDEKTLLCYGISDGDTVHFRLHRATGAGRDDVVLASAAKKYMQFAERDKDENLCLRPFALQSPSAKARMSNRCAQNGVAMMPKWVSQDKPKLFAPCGVGVDGHGNDCAFEAFANQGIWTPNVDHPNQRQGQYAQNQYGMQRVREGMHRNAAQVGKLGGA